MSVFMVTVCVLGQLDPLQPLLLESNVVTDVTESIFPSTSHTEHCASCQRLCFSHCGVRCHETLLGLTYTDRLSWFCRAWEGWPAGPLAH